MAFARTAQLSIPYEEAGTGTDVLVLLHGNFGSPRWWRPLLGRLPPGFRALAPALRGCAGTLVGTSSDFSIERLALDLHEFAQALSLPRFHLVGHSLGGGVAQQYALDFPDTLHSLTLVSPAPPGGLTVMCEGDGASARSMRMVDPESARQMRMLRSLFQLGRLMGTHRRLLREALGAMMPTARLPPAELEGLLNDAVGMSSDAFVGFTRALSRWNVEARLGELRVPTLVVGGERDVLVPAASLQRLAAALPRCELLLWPGVGHSPQLERPEDFERALYAFIAQRSPRLFLRWMWERVGHLRAGRAGVQPGESAVSSRG